MPRGIEKGHQQFQESQTLPLQKWAQGQMRPDFMLDL